MKDYFKMSKRARFSLRKYTTGTFSVLLGFTLLTAVNPSETVFAEATATTTAQREADLYEPVGARVMVEKEGTPANALPGYAVLSTGLPTANKGLGANYVVGQGPTATTPGAYDVMYQWAYNDGSTDQNIPGKVYYVPAVNGKPLEKVSVKNPNALTQAEKDAVVANVRAAMGDVSYLPEPLQIVVQDNGTVQINYPIDNRGAGSTETDPIWVYRTRETVALENAIEHVPYAEAGQDLKGNYTVSFTDTGTVDTVNRPTDPGLVQVGENTWVYRYDFNNKGTIDVQEIRRRLMLTPIDPSSNLRPIAGTDFDNFEIAGSSYMTPATPASPGVPAIKSQPADVVQILNNGVAWESRTTISRNVRVNVVGVADRTNSKYNSGAKVSPRDTDNQMITTDLV